MFVASGSPSLSMFEPVVPTTSDVGIVLIGGTLLVRPVVDVIDLDEPRRHSASGMGAGALPPGEAERALELRRADQEQRQSYWRLLLLGAFVILVIETVVSNRLSRRAARRGKHAQATG